MTPTWDQPSNPSTDLQEWYIYWSPTVIWELNWSLLLTPLSDFFIFTSSSIEYHVKTEASILEYSNLSPQKQYLSKLTFLACLILYIVITTYIYFLWCVTQCSKHFACINPLNPHNNHKYEAGSVIILTHHRWVNCWSNTLYQVTELVNGRAAIWSHIG